MLLDNLMDTQQIQAFEVSEAGTVENIGLKNLSHFHTLVIDGEAVVGAKQNRIAQTTMVLAPYSETTIPVNCVEPKPTATKPKLPNEEFEFVRSHCAPLDANIPMSQLIVNIDTN